jgi:hypothetical protein
MRCGVVWCGVVWCGVVWCDVVWCGVVWCGVVWCGVVWCGVVRCGVVCRGARLRPTSPDQPPRPFLDAQYPTLMCLPIRHDPSETQVRHRHKPILITREEEGAGDIE